MELLKILNFAKAMHIPDYRSYQYVKMFVNTLKTKMRLDCGSPTSANIHNAYPCRLT